MTAATPVIARLLRVTGVVQGVGFRPFVHRLAARHALAGWVRNAAGTVEIYIEGDGDVLDSFQQALRTDAPRVSQIDAIDAAAAVVTGTRDFLILQSIDAEGNRPVGPDLSICGDCEAELFDSANRRHRHAFITCTNCGPRYTVIRALPYDRERTSMFAFPLCPDCEREYRAPADRRYHAETVACARCGPRVWTAASDGAERASGDGAILEAAAALQSGQIVAIRGLGGFHLACDAGSDAAVRRLRRRKHRDAKPLAIMVASVDAARAVAHVSADESALLAGPERPVVLLERREHSLIAESVSPSLSRIGVMLAYTPLHHLLLAAAVQPLVMTSGNLTDEPIAANNDEALARLRDIADLFLLHDREIVSRIDDSVARVVDGAPILLRRARGYAPRGIRLPIASPRPLVAVGPHLKNTFTLVRGDMAETSPHIGDLDTVESLAHFRATLERYQDLFRIAPEVAVRDAHPGYHSTRVAEELGLPRTIVVQHHHAHVAAVAAEHGVTSKIVGLAFDGTGYGDDGNVWGAETLVADLTSYMRVGQMRYAPLPGGDLAAREPWRAALGYLSLEPSAKDAFAIAFHDVSARERTTAERQIERRLNAPLASSMGRLFDAAAAVLGVRSRSGYEGQAAMELESLAEHHRGGALPFPAGEEDNRLILDPVPLLAALGERRQAGDDVRTLAAAFHDAVAAAAANAALFACDSFGIDTVALGGGSFQNGRLLAGVRERLASRGLRVLIPRQLGPNDGAISFGQAAVAAAVLAAET